MSLHRIVVAQALKIPLRQVKLGTSEEALKGEHVTPVSQTNATSRPDRVTTS